MIKDIEKEEKRLSQEFKKNLGSAAQMVLFCAVTMGIFGVEGAQIKSDFNNAMENVAGVVRATFVETPKNAIAHDELKLK